MDIADRYSFEAEFTDGSLITQGGDLINAVRVSLIPAFGTGLPRHDLIGVKFKRRFLRHFKKMPVGGFDKEKYFAEIEANINQHRIASRKARDDKGLTPELVKEEPYKKVSIIAEECVHVIVTSTFRFYVRHFDGTVAITPPNYELYL